MKTWMVLETELLTSLLPVPAMRASPVGPHQLPILQLHLFPLASPWIYPLNKPFQCLPMRPGSPSINLLCLNPGFPREPSPVAPCPRGAFAKSRLRVVPSPASLCCCLG